MKIYLLGLATLPMLLVFGYLAAWLFARILAWGGRIVVGAFQRIRPSSPVLHAHRRAAVIYGLRRGVVFSLGEFVIVIGVDLDRERHRWADQQLRPTYPISEDFKKRMRDGGDHA